MQNNIKTSIAEDHKAMVSKTRKNPNTILNELDSNKVDLLHSLSILQAEAGEVSGVINKHIYYNTGLNMEAVIKELGDVEYALTSLYSILGLKRENVLSANIQKLEARYPKGYSDIAAMDKADEQGGR